VGIKTLLRHATRIPGVRGAWRRFPHGDIEDRVLYGAWERPNYAYGVFHSAKLAAALNLPGISVIEFGVAGGRGLLALEDAARQIGKYLGVEVRVFGFDTGIGLPPPTDFRDLPHVWGEGDYQMDVPKLKSSLSPATGLILGDIASTIPPFLQDLAFPIGFVSFDLDYYSSTSAAFSLFEGASDTRLPRVYCYFDDLIWPEAACHNPYVGEHLAINEYNAAHADRKICQLVNLRWMHPYPAEWHEQTYVMHDFAHPLYTQRLRKIEQSQHRL
jgi:hypothetical protein